MARAGRAAGGRAGRPMSDGRTRAFIALRLPATVQARLIDLVASLRRRAPGLVWVRAENLHVTIRFLGSLDAPGLEAAGAALDAAIRGRAAFRVALGGLGAFPGPRVARVVWAGVATGAEPLVALAAAIERELGARGFVPEPRPFHPHVTLARAGRGQGAADLREALGPGPALGAFRVEGVALMRSDLGPHGPRYTLLLEAPLVAAAAGATEGAP